MRFIAIFLSVGVLRVYAAAGTSPASVEVSSRAAEGRRDSCPAGVFGLPGLALRLVAAIEDRPVDEE